MVVGDWSRVVIALHKESQTYFRELKHRDLASQYKRRLPSDSRKYCGPDESM